MNKAINVLSNWAILITSPLWVIPALFLSVLDDGDFISGFIKGEQRLFWL